MRTIPKPLIVLLLTCATIISLTCRGAARQETLSGDKAIFLMRLILGVEHFTTERKTYLNLVDLLRSPNWPDPASLQQNGLPDIRAIDPSTGDALNYVVQITTSDDKKHFQASLEPSDPKTCDTGMFTDDRGVIYVGKGLGCPAR